jgi:type I restriction enzyme M protein
MQEFLKLEKILGNVSNALSLFTNKELEWIEKRIEDKGKLECISRKKLIPAKPEEIVRQLYTKRLIDKYKYPLELIIFEKQIQFGREIDQKRADIVVLKDDKQTPSMIIEVKAPSVLNDLSQLKSYLNAEGSPIGVATNGNAETILFRPYPKDFDTLSDIPKYGQTIDELFAVKKKFKDLENPRALRNVIKIAEELVLANSGFDSFDEIFKLIYAKLYDEKQAQEDEENYELKFWKYSKDANKVKQEIDKLFEEAKKEWAGIFEKSDVIKLRPEHLSVVVGELQRYCLLGSNLEVIDEAFEYLIPDVAKAKKGQFFTSREVIEMCVEMLEPTNKETVIDTACGSGGFLIQTMKTIRDKYKLNAKTLSSYASKKLYGIDFDEKSSKIAKAMMLIAGDGKSHIFKANTLDTTDENWEDIMKEFKKLELLPDFEDCDKNLQNYKKRKYFNFDVLLANPPFAGEIKEKNILVNYELSKNDKGKEKPVVGRDILFIERNLDFVREGGRLALVLPQGRFNNTSDKQIREFISKRARILAVIGLHVNTFKPHTGTKTSVIFLQKWNEDNANPKYYCPKKENYPIFFAVNEAPVRDNSGRYTKKHDLKKISEAFKKFAKSQELGFIE